MHHHFRSRDKAEFRSHQRIRLFGLTAKRRTRSQRINLPYARVSDIDKSNWSLHPSAQPLVVICLSFERQHQLTDNRRTPGTASVLLDMSGFFHLRAVATTHVPPPKHMYGGRHMH